jgi:transposase
MSPRTRWWPPIRVPDPAGVGRGRGRRRQEVRTYPTFTSSLETLADWLQAEGVTQVVMEATGQYWKPIWYVLEERGFQLLLVNARHVKLLPGRKTDVGDAAWLCELLECGLLRGSFVPPAAIRQLRDLVRYRKRLIQAHSAECQRVQKTLEDAGIKLGSVATDVLGVSGRAMLKALVAGERDPQVLAELAKGKLRKKLPQLRQALRGRFGDHHALLVGLALDHLEHLEGAIAALDGRIDEVIAPFAVARDRPGHHHRGRQARRRVHHRRDRGRHGGVPDRRAPGKLGGSLPRQQHHRGQASLG